MSEHSVAVDVVEPPRTTRHISDAASVSPRPLVLLYGYAKGVVFAQEFVIKGIATMNEPGLSCFCRLVY